MVPTGLPLPITFYLLSPFPRFSPVILRQLSCHIKSRRRVFSNWVERVFLLQHDEHHLIITTSYLPPSLGPCSLLSLSPCLSLGLAFAPSCHSRVLSSSFSSSSSFIPHPHLPHAVFILLPSASSFLPCVALSSRHPSVR